jgi:hypothetical protein
LGLLVEEQRTNLFVRSDDFGNASWVTVRAAITSNTIVAPNGTLTGDKLIASTDVNTSHFIRQEVAVTSGTTYTQTVYAKAAEYTQILMGFGADASTFVDGAVVFTLTGNGTAGIPSASITSSSITPVGNGWYRCQVSSTATATATSVFRIQNATGNTNGFTGDGYSGIFIWGAQLEAGAFATSYIPTVASQVTRSADVPSMTGANFSSWYRQDEGTIYAEYSRNATSQSGSSLYAVAINDNSTSNMISLSNNFAGVNDRYQVVSAGVAQATIIVGTATTSFVKKAGAYSTNSFQLAKNGLSGTEDTAGTIPVVDRLGIGCFLGGGLGQEFLNGTIKKIAFYPKRLTNAQLQSLTTV